MPTKVCSPTKGCGQEKDVSEFRKEGRVYRYTCNECQRHYSKQYRLNNKQKIIKKNKQYHLSNKEKVNKKQKQYRRNNIEKIMLITSRKRAKAKGLEHNIILEDIQIPEYCPVLGIKLQVADGIHSDNSPSLDRIDNTNGYSKDNIMVISYRANSLKKDATIEELEKVLAYMRAQQNQQQEEEGEHDSEATDR